MMIKSLICLLAGLFIVNTSCAQIKAVTENGDEVILNKDKTWAYIDNTITEETVIPLNTDTFEKTNSQTFLLKSKINSAGIWLNPKAWNFSKAIDNPDAEYEFSSKSKRDCGND